MIILKRQRYLRRGAGKITVHREMHQYSAQKHKHEFFEIFVILSGEGTHIGGNFRIPLQAGDVGVINCQRSHSYEETNQLNLVNVLVREDVIEMLARELQVIPGFNSLFNPKITRWTENDSTRRIRLNSRDLSQVSDWIDRLDEETTRNENGNELMARCLLTLIIGLISRRHNKAMISEYPRKQKPMGKVLTWIERHLHGNIRVGDLAEVNGMSVRSFQRSFLEIMHCTPTDYIAQCRLRRAEEMLLQKTPPFRIADVAQSCGFDDSNYFSAWFKKSSGFSPSQFRNRSDS